MNHVIFPETNQFTFVSLYAFNLNISEYIVLFQTLRKSISKAEHRAVGKYIHSPALRS